MVKSKLCKKFSTGMTLRCEIATVSPRRSNAKKRVPQDLHVVVNLHMQVLTFVYFKLSHIRP